MEFLIKQERRYLFILTIVILSLLLPLSRSYAQTTRGTGFLIGPNGYILTAAHVIGNKCAINVLTDRGDYAAQLIKIDHEKDLALLKIDSSSLPHLPLGQFNGMGRLEEIWTYGYPLGRDLGYSVVATVGHITAMQSSGSTSHFLVDAAANPGNSGGPVLNRRGEVVGVMTGKFVIAQEGYTLSEALNYAVPIEYSNDLLADVDLRASKSTSITSVAGPLDKEVSPAVVMITASSGPPGWLAYVNVHEREAPGLPYIWNKSPIRGAVKQIITKTASGNEAFSLESVTTYNLLGRVIEAISYPFGWFASREVKLYGASGNLAREEYHYPDTTRNCKDKNSLDASRCPIVSKVSIYDALGQLLQEVHKDEDGKVLVRKEVIYDSSGNIRMENSYGADEKIIWNKIYGYDCSGGVVEKSESHSKASTSVTKHIFSLDVLGRLVRAESRWGETRKIFEYRYDGSGALQKWSTELLFSDEYSQRRSYDGEGNLLDYLSAKSTGEILQNDLYILNGNRPKQLINGRQVFELNRQGQIISVYLESKGGLNPVASMSYDSYGNPLSFKWQDIAKGTSSSASFQYEHDSRGNWVRRDVIEDTGAASKRKSITIREIEYH